LEGLPARAPVDDRLRRGGRTSGGRGRARAFHGRWPRAPLAATGTA